jgi:exportin-1
VLEFRAVRVSHGESDLLMRQQSGEQELFVDEILRLLHRITLDLSPQQVVCRVILFGYVTPSYFKFFQQVHTFYEAVGYRFPRSPTNLSRRSSLLS